MKDESWGILGILLGLTKPCFSVRLHAPRREATARGRVTGNTSFFSVKRPCPAVVCSRNTDSPLPPSRSRAADT